MKKTEMAVCDGCGSITVRSRTVPNHMFHALMTIITMGLWIFIWGAAILEAMLQAPSSEKTLCPNCRRGRRWA